MNLDNVARFCCCIVAVFPDFHCLVKRNVVLTSFHWKGCMVTIWSKNIGCSWHLEVVLYFAFVFVFVLQNKNRTKKLFSAEVHFFPSANFDINCIRDCLHFLCPYFRLLKKFLFSLKKHRRYLIRTIST